MNETGFELNYALTRKEVLIGSKLVGGHQFSGLWKMLLILFQVVWPLSFTLLGGAIGFLIHRWLGTTEWIIWLCVFGFGFGLSWLHFKISMRVFEIARGKLTGLEQSFSANDKGLQMTSGLVISQQPWSTFEVILNKDGVSVLICAGGCGIIVPDRALANLTSKIQFVEQIEKWISQK